VKILHVWDQAGVAGVMAKYQRKLGIEVSVIKRDGFNGLGIDDFYGTMKVVKLPRISDPLRQPVERRIYLSLPRSLRKLVKRAIRAHRALKFYVEVARQSRRYDLLHIHSVYLACLFAPFKKKIIEFHGDDIRRYPSKRSVLSRRIQRAAVSFVRLFSDGIYVSTPDLLNEVSGEWIPNPVDAEHFSPTGFRFPKTALYIRNWYETSENAEKIATEHGWRLSILDRAHNVVIPYKRMPEFLSRFEYFIDRHLIKSLSKTAIEALALELKVVKWDGEVVDHLPEAHKPENVARLTCQIYREKLGLLNDQLE